MDERVVCEVCGTEYWIQEGCTECDRRFWDEMAISQSRWADSMIADERSRFLEPTEDEWIWDIPEVE